ncbi:MAG: cupin domain-containing protein [Candidatus Neomarinimicrobiota bacterium]|jgi:mannose-6-phosphate isomerase-like protein (cupin superfamily)
MLIKDAKYCQEIIANDNTILREILKPDEPRINIRYSLAHATLKPGQISLPHRLTSSEVYYIFEGQGLMFIDTEKSVVSPGQVIYIPPNSIQRIKNTGNSDLKFLCIVDPPWCAENEEIL